MKQEILQDSYGRVIRYLRISVTELCNFRCVYCTAGTMALTPPAHYLTRNEIARFVRIACRLGLTRIRLTGGEPLVRGDIVDIVRSLRSIEGVEDLSITTNGSKLSGMLADLKSAGLDRINISLDSMNEKRFEQVTLVNAFREVMSATFAALQAGFPVKLNMVALKGLSRDEIISFVGLARDFPLEVRFLEFMPLCGESWKPEFVLPINEVRTIVKEHFDLEELPREDNVAQPFRIRNGAGKVGFIASLTESFCDKCSRMRLSSDGNIRPCLFSDLEVPIKKLLRENAPDEAIESAIRLAVRIKPAGNAFRDNPFMPAEEEANRGAGPMIRKIGG